MMIEVRTKRRWILSVLDAVAESTDTRPSAGVAVKASSSARAANGQKGFALRLKAATRPLAKAAR